MTDLDRTNAYSYRGKNDTKHWEKAMLRVKGETEEEIMTKIERIKCYWKNIEIWYFPKDLTIKRWENFLENHSRGNETFIKFQEKDGRIVTINPSQWGSVEVED